jgi:hypothetical protein
MTSVGVKRHPRLINVNLLPCSISHDGPANVSSFFVVESDQERSAESDQEHLSAHFRGRLLEGQRIPLPDGNEGLLLNPQCPSMHVEDGHATGRFLEIRGTFDAVNVWVHDRNFGSDDPFQRALAWIELASAIHD